MIVIWYRRQIIGMGIVSACVPCVSDDGGSAAGVGVRVSCCRLPVGQIPSSSPAFQTPIHRHPEAGMRVLSVRSLLTPITVLASQQRFAGHAKWQNIAHTKAANDKAKGQRTNRYCMLIRRACVSGTDPKVNDKLRDIIALALKSQVPRATIDRQIERAKQVKLKEMVIEVMTPGGAFLLCEIETDNISRTRQDMKKILRKITG